MVSTIDGLRPPDIPKEPNALICHACAEKHPHFKKLTAGTTRSTSL
jgi:hypothetical protein